MDWGLCLTRMIKLYKIDVIVNHQIDGSETQKRIYKKANVQGEQKTIMMDFDLTSLQK